MIPVLVFLLVAAAEPLTTAPAATPDRLSSRKEAPMESICPNCGRHDSIYARFGGALVCRACFVTETLLGSWLALEGPAPVAPGHDNCEEKRR